MTDEVARPSTAIVNEARISASWNSFLSTKAALQISFRHAGRHFFAISPSSAESAGWLQDELTQVLSASKSLKRFDQAGRFCSNGMVQIGIKRWYRGKLKTVAASTTTAAFSARTDGTLRRFHN